MGNSTASPCIARGELSSRRAQVGALGKWGSDEPIGFAIVDDMPPRGVVAFPLKGVHNAFEGIGFTMLTKVIPINNLRI